MRSPKTSTRALHLVDLENLVGGASPTIADLDWLVEDYRRASGWAVGDLMTVGTCRRTAKRAWWAWREHYACSWILRDGADGGEMALLEACSPEDLTSFSTVVVGSGDHAFAPLAADLARLGHHVLVVAHPDALSAKLRLAGAGLALLTRRPPTPAADRILTPA